MEAAMAAQIQQMAVQQASGQRMANGQDGGEKTAEAGSQGAFSALLQQMLGTGGEASILNVGVEQKAFLLEQMRKQLGQEGTEQGMQLLAEMIAVHPAIIQQVDASELAELVGQAVQPAQSTAAAMQGMQELLLAGTAGQDVAQVVQQAIPGLASLNQVVNQQENKTATATGEVIAKYAGATSDNLEIVAGAAGTAQENSGSGQSQFQRAVFQAQQRLNQDGTNQAELSELLGNTNKKADGKESGTDNVLAFPQQLKLEQLQHTQELSELGEVDGKDILLQVKTGLKAGADRGENEFTIKLKPEGLGEITVRMLEVAGKITLSITTANAQTQKLLNAELTALRDAVRPYNVEVQQVESQNTQHFDLGQQRESFLHQQQQSNHQNSRQGRASYYEPQPEQPEAETPAYYVPSGLNTVV